jgi:hypothetical protein
MRLLEGRVTVKVRTVKRKRTVMRVKATAAMVTTRITSDDEGDEGDEAAI